MNDQMLDKIRKLLAMAEDSACTIAEAEAFNAKAARLIADYGIDEALLAQAGAGGGVAARMVVLHPPYAREKATLLASIAAQLRCATVLHQQSSYDADHRRTNQFSLECFGHDSDLALAEMLFTSLLVQAGRDLLRARHPRGESAAAFRRSWWLGFADAIGQRLAEADRASAAAAEERFSAASTSTAIVLADRLAESEAVRSAAYPRLRSIKRELSGSGGADGWAAGHRAELGRSGKAGPRARGEMMPQRSR